MVEIRVANWAEAQEVLFAESWNSALLRFRSPFVFRGLSHVDYSLQTTLARLGANRPVWLPQLERHLLRNFRKYAYSNAVEHDSLWYWLALAQHHGLATRLLDWTYSPNVALHFATADTTTFDRDGVVYMVDLWQAQRELPPQLLEPLQAVGAFAFNAELLSELIPTFDELAALMQSAPHQEFVLFFEPPSLDDRIVNQYALFSVMSRADGDLAAWLDARPGLWKKVVIAANAKWEIRDKLDQLNSNERVFFPGLDGLCRWLNRAYYPRQ